MLRFVALSEYNYLRVHATLMVRDILSTLMCDHVSQATIINGGKQLREPHKNDETT